MAPTDGTSQRRRVVLGVSGGIAAYKACELLRLLTESGHEVRVVPTAAALAFVGAPTWAALSGHPVTSEAFDHPSEVNHVALGRWAELVVVAPATADLLARAAGGLANDLLTNVLLTARCPVMFAPAMHTEMWQHPATVANVALLGQRGAFVLEPAVGRLTGADTGPGRLPEPAEIFAHAGRLLARADRAGAGGCGEDLRGRRVVITAGGTREPLDPVRFLGNRSSGLQGYAFARTAVSRGAQVTLVAANVSLPDPAGVTVVTVDTTDRLREAVLAAAVDADVVVMAGAPADFRPARYESSKIKKSPDGAGLTLQLVATPDIAAELGASKRPGQVLVAFAAETDDAIERGRQKLIRKRADLIVINEVGPDRGFGTAVNAATVLGADGSSFDTGELTKDDLADRVWDAVVARLSSPDTDVSPQTA